MADYLKQPGLVATVLAPNSERAGTCAAGGRVGGGASERAGTRAAARRPQPWHACCAACHQLEPLTLCKPRPGHAAGPWALRSMSSALRSIPLVAPADTAVEELLVDMGLDLTGLLASSWACRKLTQYHVLPGRLLRTADWHVRGCRQAWRGGGPPVGIRPAACRSSRQQRRREQHASPGTAIVMLSRLPGCLQVSDKSLRFYPSLYLGKLVGVRAQQCMLSSRPLLLLLEVQPPSTAVGEARVLALQLGHPPRACQPQHSRCVRPGSWQVELDETTCWRPNDRQACVYDIDGTDDDAEVRQGS